MKKYGKGWFNESRRHSLARQGIKTGRKRSPLAKCYHRAYHNLVEKQKHKLNPSKREYIISSLQKKPKKFNRKLGDRYSECWHISFSKENPTLMNKFRNFLHKNISMKLSEQPKHIQESEEVISAKKDIENVTSFDKFKSWISKHKKVIAFMGLGGLLGITGSLAGLPTLMMNVNTGEIVAVGGTLIGKYGMIGQTVLTGMGVIEEAKVISHDTHKELFKDIQEEVQEERLVSPHEIEIKEPEPKILVMKVKPKREINLSTYDSSEYGILSELSSKPIPYSKLTNKEKKTLYSSINKVKDILGKKGKKIKFTKDNLQIVKRVGPDDSAFGGHQGNLIQLDRDMLKDPDKTEGVLLHESLHKIYGVRDKTREIENLHIDYLGELM